MNIYKNALDAQGACNLSGVVQQFARDMQIVCEEVRAAGGGTDQINTHPVCRLYAEQIAWLSGAGSCAAHSTYLRAHDACKRRAVSEGEEHSVASPGT